MNLNQLYYFVAVCDRKSFSKAAADIFVTQPTLSKQIAAMESELGMKLIDRHKSGNFRVTAAGEILLDSFRRMLQEYEGAAEAAQELGQRKKIYNIGVMEAWGIEKLIRVCSDLVEAQFPDVKLVFEFMSPRKLNEQLRASRLDIALYTEGVYSPVDGYTREKIAEIKNVFFVAANHSEKLENLPEEDFFSYPLADVSNLNTRFTYEVLGRRHLMIEKRESMQAIKTEVLAGRGFGLADTWSEVSRDPRFALKELPGAWREAIVVWRQIDDSACTAALLDRIRSWAKNPEF